MKKKLLLLLLTLSIPFAMTACSDSDKGKENKPQEMVEAPSQVPTPKEETTTAQTSENVVMSDEEVIRECLALLGKNDDEAAKIWNGGQQNYTEDGEFLIGRMFNVNLFGEETMVNTNYSEAGIANGLTIELKGKEAAHYKDELVKIFGKEKERTDTPSEGGAIYTLWEEEGKQIYLYETEGLLTLEMSMPDNQ